MNTEEFREGLVAVLRSVNSDVNNNFVGNYKKKELDPGKKERGGEGDEVILKELDPGKS